MNYYEEHLSTNRSVTERTNDSPKYKELKRPTFFKRFKAVFVRQFIDISRMRLFW